MKIFKYQFDIDDFVEIEMPVGAKVLSFQMQGLRPCLWALVDEEAEKEKRRFRIYGTGHDIFHPEDKFIGTVQDGPFVWHLFEVAHGH